MASEDSKLQQLPHHSALSFEYTDQFTVPQQWHTVSASMLRAPLSQFGTGFKEGRLSGARAVEEDIRDDMSIEELKALEHKCMLIDKKNAENPEYRTRYHHDPKEKYITTNEAYLNVFGDVEEEELPIAPPGLPYTDLKYAFAEPKLVYPYQESILQPPPLEHCIVNPTPAMYEAAEKAVRDAEAEKEKLDAEKKVAAAKKDTAAEELGAAEKEVASEKEVAAAKKDIAAEKHHAEHEIATVNECATKNVAAANDSISVTHSISSDDSAITEASTTPHPTPKTSTAAAPVPVPIYELPKATPHYIPPHFIFAPALPKLNADGTPWKGFTDTTEEGQNKFVDVSEEDQCRQYYVFRMRKDEEDGKAREGEGKWWEKLMTKARIPKEGERVVEKVEVEIEIGVGEVERERERLERERLERERLERERELLERRFQHLREHERKRKREEKGNGKGKGKGKAKGLMG